MGTLREKQLASLQKILNLNTGASNSSRLSETIFSVLIYDKQGQDIISPLISVKELREMGVTLHLMLHSERGEVPDVPAIYFCQPTEENLVRIGQDFNEGLYSAYYLNFISPISRQKLEDLAQYALQANCQAAIKKVYDQYVNFISLEEDMFTLRHRGTNEVSYYAINRGEIKDSEMDVIINSIVDSLFSVFVNMGQVPIIRSQKGNAAAFVAERLDKKLRENLRDTRNSFFTGIASTEQFAAGQLSFHRPLLVLVDRNMDLASPLRHTWTYQAMLQDLLSFSLNRVRIPQSRQNQDSIPKVKEYDFHSQDHFWETHKGDSFPNVAQAVESELDEYKKAEEKVKGLKAGLPDGDPNSEHIDLFSDNTAKLTSAIISLPQLIKQKANIDKHMSTAMALLELIKARKLDVHFEMEEKMMARTPLEDQSLIKVLNDPTCGTPEDKLRLFLIHYLCSSHISDEEYNACVAALEENGANIKPLLYVKRWKSLMKITTTGPSDYVSGVSKSASMLSKFYQGSFIKNFVLKENKLTLTRIVDNLLEQKDTDEENSFLYFDPKLIRPTDAAANRTKSHFQEAVVFVVGGGNYFEYTNLRSYATKSGGSSGRKRVVYGCTDVVNAEQFLAQLSKLGEEMT